MAVRKVTLGLIAELKAAALAAVDADDPDVVDEKLAELASIEGDESVSDELRAEAMTARDDVDQVRAPKFVDASNSDAELVSAIVAAMAETQEVTKDRTNADHHYKFASVESMLAAVRGPLFKRGVLLVARPHDLAEREMQAKSGTRGTVVDLKVDFEFTNGRAKLVIVDWPGQGIDYSDKAQSKALTAALKTFVRVQWLLPALTDDGDADQSSPERGAPAAAGGVWARVATIDQKRATLVLLVELVGHEGSARAYAKMLSDTVGEFPAVLAEWLCALPDWQKAARRKVQEEAQAARAAQDRTAEAVDAPAPDVDVDEPPPPAPRVTCGRRLQGSSGVTCLLEKGHEARGELKHVGASGVEFDDDHSTPAPEAGPDDVALEGFDADEPPATDAPAGDDGDLAGTVDCQREEGESDGSYTGRLRRAGCKCARPLDPKSHNDTCPIRGHGIPF